MKTIKSQPKLKNSISKYQNFFTEKNWDRPMYMDDRAAEKPDYYGQILQSYSSLTIQPRAKLSYSLHEKVGAVLSDSRKMGMIQKVENPNTRKSLAKISQTSTLPPIKTEVQQTFQYLNKLKNQLNQASLKCIKLSNQVSNIRGQTNITKEKVKAVQQILDRKGEKQQKQIINRKEMTEEVRFHHDVRANKFQILKNDVRVYAKRKNILEQRLKNLKNQLNSVSVQLDNQMTTINNNLYTKKIYKTKQQLASQDFYLKAEIAKAKLNHQKNAQKVHQQLQQIQSYNEDQYRFQTNLQGHFNILKQLRVQQVLSKIIDSNFNKNQNSSKQTQKAYALMKMYADLNTESHRKHQIQTMQSLTLSNRSLIKNNSSLTQSHQPANNGQIDIVNLYENTFNVKKQLQQKIKTKQSQIIELQAKKNKLMQKWIDKAFNDSVTNGSKAQPKKQYSKQIKKLMQKQKKLQKDKMVQTQVLIWLKKQQQKLNFQFSKKMTNGQKLLKILEFVCSQAKNIKQIPKYTVLAQLKQQVNGKSKNQGKK